jgi:DNA replication protein DnaC
MIPPNGNVPEALRALGLRTSRDALDAFFTHATKSRLSPIATVEHLIALERKEREVKNLAQRTRLAMLGKFKPLDQFDWNHPRTINHALYEQLLGFDFIEQGANVLLRGQSGVGKTTLAQNLGFFALQKGYRVRFTTLAQALADLGKRDSLAVFERRLLLYTKPAVLIVDELGYLPADARGGDVLYNIISRRHQQRPTVITTNLAFKQWGTIFPGAACVAALVDRFTESCHVIDIDADSWRQKKGAK